MEFLERLWFLSFPLVSLLLFFFWSHSRSFVVRPALLCRSDSEAQHKGEVVCVVSRLAVAGRVVLTLCV